LSVVPNTRQLLRFLILSSCLLRLSGQSADDVQMLVEKLYPKNERLKEIRMGAIVRELGIREGGVVADVGCGSGNLSIILSNVVGNNGKVYCEDIDDGRQFGLGAAKNNVKKQHVKNVVLIPGEKDNPKLPAGSLDGVMIVNSYHEMPEYQAMLKHIRESLKPGGHLVIMDNRPNRTAQRPRDRQVHNHVLSADLAAGELEAAGFRIIHREDAFIDNPDSESSYWLISALSR
jgi:ubiquinone/menaquinone biosynthesis C-methylase UbiE